MPTDSASFWLLPRPSQERPVQALVKASMMIIPMMAKASTR